MTAHLNTPHALVLFQQNELLLIQKENQFFFPTLVELSALSEFTELNNLINLANLANLTTLTPITRFHTLGFLNNQFCYCGEISTFTVSEKLILFPIRQAFALLEDQWFSVLAKAMEVLNWDKLHQFCGGCGTPTYHQLPSFERHCPSCQAVFYPRISPSIIVRVCKNQEILLARNAHAPSIMHGLIAGYIEPGESAEEAVIREVREEVSLNIKNIRYFGSQPWPFPDVLMLAFTADYASGEIQVDNHEIVEAAWYTRHSLPQWQSQSKSIARKLIEEFIG